MSSAWVIAVVGLIAFALIWGYYAFSRRSGTAKRPENDGSDIRVVQDGGYSVSFGASAARNLVAVVDIMPRMYGLGLVSIAYQIRQTSRRHGGRDVRRARAARPHSGGAGSRSGRGRHRCDHLAPTEEEFALLGSFVSRRTSSSRSVRRVHVAARRPLSKHLPENGGAHRQLLRLYESESERARARAADARSERAARERHAIVREMRSAGAISPRPSRLAQLQGYGRWRRRKSAIRRPLPRGVDRSRATPHRIRKRRSGRDLLREQVARRRTQLSVSPAQSLRKATCGVSRVNRTA